VDDRPRDAQGIRDALRSVAGVNSPAVITPSNQIVAYLKKKAPFEDAVTPDVVLLAVNPPAYQGRATLAQIRDVVGHPPVIILGRVTDGPASKYLNAGAADYMMKDDLSQIGSAVRNLVTSRMALRSVTPRQIEVLVLIAEGMGTQAIAARLKVSTKTVEAHRTSLLRRLGIDSVAGLVHYAIRAALVELEPPPPEKAKSVRSARRRSLHL